MRYVRRRRGRNWAKWLYAALFAAVAVGCGDDDPGRELSSSGIVRTRGGPIRPIAPLSGSVSGSRQPVFSFNEGRSGRVDICYDRACEHVIESIQSNYGRAQPETPLPAGTLFWRVVSHHGPSAVWQLVIPSRDSGLTTAFGVVPDYNGDGLADVAIGVPARDTGTVQVSMGRFFPVAVFDVTLEGGARFGRGIAAVGDLNGDGVVDLAVASGVDPGVVTIYNGGSPAPTMGLTLPPGDVTAGFGMTTASAGDVNGDGYGDIVVGGLEAAQVFLGGANGVATKPAHTLAGMTGGNALTVQGPADVNGDGNPDILVGGVLYLGNGSGFTAQTPFTPGPGAGFVGDVDGDGLTDVAAGGAVLPGSPAGVDPGRFLFIQPGEEVRAAAGDVDGDGHADVVSSIISPVNVPDERERIYFGAPSGCFAPLCRSFAALFIAGHDRTGGNLRAIIAAAGDVNGDGGDDLVVATPENAMVYLHVAGARDVPFNSPLPFTGDPGFGSSLAALFGTAPLIP